MPAPIYLGDEVTGAGFRLAGIESIVPAPGAEAPAFAEACARAPLVLLCASVAARLDEATVRARVIASSPPVAVLPDLAGTAPLADIATWLRRQLGLET
jgi:vacuolar-type H+-ATPase subunit F/Vma7